MELKEITKEEFNRLPRSKKIFCHEEFPRRFALLSPNNNLEPVALCWQSELIQPQIIDNGQSPLLWFGIDQQILAINKIDGTIALAITLPSNLLELLVNKTSVLLRAELEVYSFSVDGIIQMVYSLPEISESMEADSNNVKVTLIDGQVLSLDI